jgi:hypothetical protein
VRHDVDARSKRNDDVGAVMRMHEGGFVGAMGFGHGGRNRISRKRRLGRRRRLEVNLDRVEKCPRGGPCFARVGNLGSPQRHESRTASIFSLGIRTGRDERLARGANAWTRHVAGLDAGAKLLRGPGVG